MPFDFPIDFDAGLCRCGGNRALYIRFLKRFKDDGSMQALAAAIETGDAKRAFTHAHTLKGLSAQLGLNAVSFCASRLCGALRNTHETLPPEAPTLLGELVSAYAEVLSAIAAL